VSTSTLSLLQDNLIAGLSGTREVVRVGGLTALFSPTNDLKWLNQSVPEGAFQESDLDALLTVYEERGREPFFEFAPDLCPELPPLLESRGLQRIQQFPVMALDHWTSVPTVARAARPDEYEEMLRQCNICFGQPAESDPDGAQRLAKQVESGVSLTAVMHVDDQMVSNGVAFGSASIREVAGLCTLPEFRRQGHCTSVIHCLLNQHFAAGGQIAWLTPGDDGAEALYTKVGFVTIGTQVAYGVPATSAPEH